MNEVTEVVIALLMLVNGEMKEARIQTGYAECIKGARVAKRGLKINSNIKYSCIKCEAILEDNIDGSKSIKKLIIKLFSLYPIVIYYIILKLHWQKLCKI